MKHGYTLLDSGSGQKWERWGPYILKRPAPQAIWEPKKGIQEDASFSRKEHQEGWSFHKTIRSSWKVEMGGNLFQVMLTDFGHLGLFPEHAPLWDWMGKKIEPGIRFLNLFAYTGGASLVAAKAGAQVSHLDASSGMVDRARQNWALNGSAGSIRWIVEDVKKFVAREKRRGSRYEAILLDPPTFGRGTKGELFKIEEDLFFLLKECRALLSERPQFILLSSHTPGFTPCLLSQLLREIFVKSAEGWELKLEAEGGSSIPSGAVARIIWS